jgi:hypothetical protein
MKMANVTIAQALRRVKKLKGQIAEHEQRAKAGVSYVSTKVPAFRFNEERLAMHLAQAEMLDLESRIAVANATAQVTLGAESFSMAKAVRALQEMKGQIVFLKGLNLRSEVLRERESEFSDEKNAYVTRYNEVTWVSDLSEKDRDQQVKDLQSQFETLNNAVEDMNHQVVV